MALFGGYKDINTFKGISREVLENVISQNCGYYKVKLDQTPINVYGEAQNKYFIGPVLLNCLIVRGDYQYKKDEYGVDVDRSVEFRFLKYHLEKANIVPEAGDAILYNELFYHVDGGPNENQLILGKDPDYSYESGLDKFGSSYSITLSCHLSSPEILGIKRARL
jgi:hypothetical protein